MDHYFCYLTSVCLSCSADTTLSSILSRGQPYFCSIEPCPSLWDGLWLAEADNPILFPIFFYAISSYWLPWFGPWYQKPSQNEWNLWRSFLGLLGKTKGLSLPVESHSSGVWIVWRYKDVKSLFTTNMENHGAANGNLSGAWRSRWCRGRQKWNTERNKAGPWWH